MNLLYKHVRDGLLRITLLVGPPRCLSTAIAVALAQSPDVDFYVHEPFAKDYDGKPSSASGVELISRLLKQLGKRRKITSDHPARIIVKECSTHLRPRHFRFLAQHSRNRVVIVRSPMLQLSSVARICKWIWAGCPDSFNFQIGRLKEKDLRKYARRGDLETYFLNSWRSIERQIAMLEEGRDPGFWIAVDSELVRLRSDEGLRALARGAGLSYSDRMLSGWRKDHLFNIDNDEWTWKAAKARGLHGPRRSAPVMEEFPESWRAMIEEVLLIYLRIIRNRHFMAEDLSGLSKAALAQLPPDTGYGLTFAKGLTQSAAHRVRKEIRRVHSKYAGLFDCLDAIAG